MGVQLIFAEKENANFHKNTLVSYKEEYLYFIQCETPALITRAAVKQVSYTFAVSG